VYNIVHTIHAYIHRRHEFERSIISITKLASFLSCRYSISYRIESLQSELPITTGMYGGILSVMHTARVNTNLCGVYKQTTSEHGAQLIDPLTTTPIYTTNSTQWRYFIRDVPALIGNTGIALLQLCFMTLSQSVSRQWELELLDVAW